jgi:hypothetical protein
MSGLNAPIKRAVVRDMIATTRATVAFIQEMKFQLFDDRLISKTPKQKFKAKFSFLPASGTSGGILIIVFEDHYKLVSSNHTRFTLTVNIQMLNGGEEWTLTGVYGPQSEAENGL